MTRVFLPVGEVKMVVVAAVFASIVAEPSSASPLSFNEAMGYSYGLRAL
jgi:hypothetical protein